MSVQDVKDSLYVALRNRVAAINPDHTVVVRGVVRPAVVVVEDELPGAAVDGIAPVDCFCLRWTGLTVTQGLARLVCESRYATDGTAGQAGMDRGRALAALDAELVAALSTAPQNTALDALAETAMSVASATASGTAIFWSDVQFGAATMHGERMERSATVEVFGYV